MENNEKQLLVRLLIFSGRPDPEWSINEEDIISGLKERVQSVVDKERIEKAPPGVLGYRGFLVQNKAQLDELPTEFVVYKGVLVEQPGPKEQYWRDVSGIEEFLLSDAKRRGFGELLVSAGVKTIG